MSIQKLLDTIFNCLAIIAGTALAATATVAVVVGCFRWLKWLLEI